MSKPQDTPPVRRADGSAVDYDLLPDLVGYHLRRAQVTVFQHFNRSVGEAGVSPGQFGVLTLIAANPGLSQSTLARATGVERSTMVAVIDDLEDRRLVERRPSPVDRRSYALRLSDRGDALLTRVKARVRDHEAEITAGLDAAEKEVLIRLLARLAGAG